MKSRSMGYWAALALALALPLLIVQPVYQNVLIWICLYAIMGAAWNLGWLYRATVVRAGGFLWYWRVCLDITAQIASAGNCGNVGRGGTCGSLWRSIGWPDLRYAGPFFGLADARGG